MLTLEGSRLPLCTPTGFYLHNSTNLTVPSESPVQRRQPKSLVKGRNKKKKHTEKIYRHSRNIYFSYDHHHMRYDQYADVPNYLLFFLQVHSETFYGENTPSLKHYRYLFIFLFTVKFRFKLVSRCR